MTARSECKDLKTLSLAPDGPVWPAADSAQSSANRLASKSNASRMLTACALGSANDRRQIDKSRRDCARAVLSNGMPQSIHRLMVSYALFDVATQAVRAYSLETGRFESINSTIACAADRLSTQPIEADQLMTLLSSDMLDGPVRIHLIIKDNWTADFRAARARLDEAAGQALSVKQVFAALAKLTTTRCNRLGSFQY